MNSGQVKKLAQKLGADLVGIASAKTLNAFPPDPRWPQTPEKILKALQKAHLFSLWNKADLIGDEPEAKQYTERAKKRAQLEFDQMEILSNFKPFKRVSVLNLDYFSEGSPYAEKLDNDA